MAAIVTDATAMEMILKLKRMNFLFSFLTPDFVATIAYNMHVVRHSSHKDTPAYRASKQVVDWFESLEAPPGSLDEIYLMRLRAEAASLANATTNLKDSHVEMRRKAHKKKEDEDKKTIIEILIAAFWNLVYRGLMLTGFGSLGIVIARSLLPFMADTGTSDKLVSVIGFCVASFFSFLVSRGYNEYKRRLKDLTEDNRDKHDDKLYDLLRLSQIRLHVGRLHLTWFGYTEIKYWVPVEASHAGLIVDEMSTEASLEVEFAQKTMSPLMRHLHTNFEWCKEKVGRKKVSQPVPNTSTA